MAAGIKYDDGTSFISNCFPVRTMHRENEADGAWLVAYRAEQRRQFKAVVCAKQPRTFSRIKEERRRNFLSAPQLKQTDVEESTREEAMLDGFYLLKHCCIEDPSDLCSVNISSSGLSSAREEDFQLFDNVAYVNAADNELKLEIFDRFPAVRELELPVNGLRGLRLDHDMFKQLEMLDLSYNSLLPDDLLTLGCLRKLKVLYLTGNNLSSLPVKMAACYSTGSDPKKWRYPNLEILGLDHNELDHIQAFAPLAGLKRLMHLSLEHNKISCVPHLQARATKGSSNGSQVAAGHASTSMVSHGLNPEVTGPSDSLQDKEPPDRSVIRKDHANGEYTKEESDIPKDADSPSGHIDDGEKLSTGDAEGAIPFPELRFLSLAHNNINSEEDLLPVAAWPSLEELFLHGNPLTETHSGDPPLLKRFLQDELGIAIFRKKPVFEKPSFEVPLAKPGRLVKSVIPPIPRINVEKLLALEAPKQDAVSVQKAEVQWKSRTESVASGTAERVSTAANFESIAEEFAAAGPKPTAVPANDNGTFFMTQVNESDAERPGVRADVEEAIDLERPKPALQPGKTELGIGAKYEGYEELFDETDEDCLLNTQLPKDMSTSVKVLRHILAHPTTYRKNEVQLEKRQRTYEPYEKRSVAAAAELVTGAQKIAIALEKARTTETVCEVSLNKALDDPKLRGQYPEADRLLQKIQRKYASARVDSMKEAKEVRSAIQSVMKRAAQLRDETTSMTGLPSLAPPRP